MSLYALARTRDSLGRYFDGFCAWASLHSTGVDSMFVVVDRLLSNPKSQIFATEDCDDGSRPGEQHLVVLRFNEEIVKEEVDIIRPIMAVEDEPLMMLGSGPNIIKEDFSNDLDGQHSTDEMVGDGVAGIKRRRRDLSSDGVRNFATASGRGRLKEDLESSTWRRRQDF
ncbi:hypothetical protein Tco_0260942 [Tanacetum coccineum]